LQPELGLPSLKIPDFGPPAPRDRNAFYWRNKPADESSRWVFECEEFRHQADAESFECIVVVPARGGDSGLVECIVSATNLPEPQRFKLAIKIDYIKRDAVKTARNLLIPPAVIDLLRKIGSSKPSKTAKAPPRSA
jgi:hypothetical protein